MIRSVIFLSKNINKGTEYTINDLTILNNQQITELFNSNPNSSTFHEEKARRATYAMILVPDKTQELISWLTEQNAEIVSEDEYATGF